MLLAVNIVQENFPPGGLYAVADLAGLTDIDAITLSRRSSHGAATRTSPLVAIVIAALANAAALLSGLGAAILF